MNEQNRADFSIHFDGNNEMNALVLSKIINDTAELVKQTADNEKFKEDVELKVKPFVEGSFQVDFSAITSDLLPLIPTIAPFAPYIAKTIKGYFDIKKHLKGKPPKEIVSHSEHTEITNEDGVVLNAPHGSANITNNINIDNLVVNITNCAKQHNPEGGFSFESVGEKSSFTNEDIEIMAKPISISETTTNEVRKEKATVNLVINKLALAGKLMLKYKTKPF